MLIILTFVCSLILDAGLIKDTQNNILAHQSHHPEPTLAPIPLALALALPLPLTPNPKSAEELTGLAKSLGSSVISADDFASH